MITISVHKQPASAGAHIVIVTPALKSKFGSKESVCEAKLIEETLRASLPPELYHDLLNEMLITRIRSGKSNPTNQK